MTERYVIVTGAAQGIGRATTLHLAAQGFHLFAGVRKLADGDTLVAAGGTAVMPILLDVTDPAQIVAAADQVRTVVGAAGLAGLINNAGVAIAGPLEFMPLDALRNQLEVNVVGQIAVTQAFLPLIRQGNGRIINISSMAGRVAGPGTGPYHASKFALEALTDTLRQELAPWAIDVVSIQPGVINTPIWEKSLARARQMVAALPDAAHRLYGPQMVQQLARSEQQRDRGIPAERVAAIVSNALTATRPRTRYQVGFDALIAVNLVARLPDRWRDWLLARRG
ncbi:MAG: SDR family oxidoreductase [Caldilineaceae bacterium]